MKILVFSDSHSELNKMRNVTEMEKPDMILHLGDYLADLQELRNDFPDIPCCGVIGNCDRCRGTITDIRTIDGVRLFLTHGHKYDVKNSLTSLYYASLEKNAQIALFGHTHMLFHEKFGSVELLNPGSIGKGHMNSYARLEIQNGLYQIDLFQV